MTTTKKQYTDRPAPSPIQFRIQRVADDLESAAAIINLSMGDSVDHSFNCGEENIRRSLDAVVTLLDKAARDIDATKEGTHGEEWDDELPENYMFQSIEKTGRIPRDLLGTTLSRAESVARPLAKDREPDGTFSIFPGDVLSVLWAIDGLIATALATLRQLEEPVPGTTVSAIGEAA